MPRARSASATLRVRSQDCTRLTDSCTFGSKSCTPRLARLQPMADQPVEHILGRRARVDLDGDLGVGREGEAGAQPVHDLGQPLRRHQRRRAAAPMDMLHPQLPPDRRGDQVDFGQHRVGVGFHRLGLVHRGGVAAAVPAQLGAERHVQIERQHRVVRQGGQPAAIDPRIHRRREMRRRRVAGVARHARVVFLDDRCDVHAGKMIRRADGFLDLRQVAPAGTLTHANKLAARAPRRPLLGMTRSFLI